MKIHLFLSSFLLFVPMVSAAAAAAEAVSPAVESPVLKAVEVIRQVGPEGAGNAAATAAWKMLLAQPASDMPVILAGMDNAHAVAKNYFYSLVRAMADKPQTQLPVQALEQFVLNPQHDAVARKLCYDVLLQRDVSVRERTLPKLLKDACAPLRREAVDRLVLMAKAALAEGKKDVATAHYQDALKGALEEEQVKSVADALKDLGKNVDLLQHFGFITDWQVMGPFHNKGRAGFAEAFPVEPPVPVKPEETYRGMDGPLKWKKIQVTDPMGLVLFNKELVEKKEVTAYAVTNFLCKDPVAAQIRLGCKNAWKVWLNGELLFERDEYHRGRRIDQYILPVNLRSGSNQVLVKCCQNEEVQTWTGEWQFQLRITDLNGDALSSAPAEPVVKPAK